MGILSVGEPQHHLVLPHTPPELSSPQRTTYPARPSEYFGTSWASAVPISPPMSNYERGGTADMASGKSADDRPSPNDAGQAISRPQLPSLSSLFGPSPQGRPLHSPLSDRPTAYSSTSPLDRPGTSSTGIERSYSSSSYFPQSGPPSLSQPRSTYEPRLEDRPSFPPLSRPHPGPHSPHSREPRQHRPDSRSGYASSTARWSVSQDPARGEYTLGSREQPAYTSPTERLPPPLVTQHSSSRSFEGHRVSHPSTPKTAPATTASEVGVPVKDGLGPKIWTGTHFLPRFVRAAEVAGEGMCYFYDDGTHCKTVIDGEAVNAHWGVTKAGKPRKRLAIACVTCREKKIKCDPDFPRCVQCEKFGRVCRFKNAPRGGHNTSPSTPPAEPDDMRRPAGMGKPEHHRPGSTSSASVSPRATMRPGSPEEVGGLPHKRMRIGFDSFPAMVSGPRSPAAATPHPAKSPMQWQPQPELPRIQEDMLYRAWQTDPYVSDPQAMTTIISSFFAHVDSTALRFLPEQVLKPWLQGNHAHRKSPEDMMLVYSILTVGVAFSGGPKNIASEYSQVARYATERAKLSLQLVQTRLLLSLYYLSISRLGDANDMSSAAISACTCLQLNLEPDRAEDSEPATFPYNLTRSGYEECRRRTFWSCFILERLNGTFPSRVGIIHPEDIFIRLPSGTEEFEEQRGAAMPTFEPDMSLVQHGGQGLGVMGYVVGIVAIWGDLMTTLYRLANRNTLSEPDFQDFHHRISARLDDWRASLPQTLTYTASNVERALRAGSWGSLVTMHLLYHRCIINLHRHVPSQFLATAASQRQHLEAARSHARWILDMVAGIMRRDGEGGIPSVAPPTLGHAVAEATDVLTAEGSIADMGALLEDLAGAEAALRYVGAAWGHGRRLGAAVARRLGWLADVRDGRGEMAVDGVLTFVRKGTAEAGGARPAGPCWQVWEPMERRFPKEMDCVYGTLVSPFSVTM